MADPKTLHVPANDAVTMPAGSAEAIVFDGPGATLTIGPGTPATATITGFVATDRIEFIGQHITGLSTTSEAGTVRVTAYDGDDIVDTLIFKGGDVPPLQVTLASSGATIIGSTGNSNVQTADLATGPMDAAAAHASVAAADPVAPASDLLAALCRIG